MADVFYTVLIIWVLWRIFGGSAKSTVYHRHSYDQPGRKEGEVSVSPTESSGQKKDNDKGEYVDFEEIK